MTTTREIAAELAGVTLADVKRIELHGYRAAVVVHTWNRRSILVNDRDIVLAWTAIGGPRRYMEARSRWLAALALRS